LGGWRNGVLGAGPIECGIRRLRRAQSSRAECGMGTNNPAGRSCLVAPSRSQSHLVKPKKSKKTGGGWEEVLAKNAKGAKEEEVMA